MSTRSATRPGEPAGFLSGSGSVTRRPALHGRRKGKPLSARRTHLMASLYRQLAIDVASPPPDRLEPILPGASRINLEIGFGGGEHLVAEARRMPEAGFIGVEPFVNGMAKAVAAIDAEGLGNIRLFGGDAAILLEWLPPGCLARVDLLYPDPWPKRRHWKRRFVAPANLDRLARVLEAGGVLRFVSDVDSYVAWTLSLIGRRQDFVWTAERADDWRLPFASWPGTRYEAKAVAEGRRPAYLTFRRR